MKQGTTTTFNFHFNIDLNLVNSIDFFFHCDRDNKQKREPLVTKTYPTDGYERDGVIYMPLKQEETAVLPNKFYIEPQINFIDKSSIKAHTKAYNMEPTIYTHFIDDNESSGMEESIDISFDVDESIMLGFDYNGSINKPKVNGNELIGDKTGAELDLQDKLIAGVNITIAADGKTISAASGSKFIIVEELPTEDIDLTAIYLLPREDEEESNIYDEYIYIENTSNWEKIGSTEVDLSNYYTKTESDNKYQPIIDSSHKLDADLLADGTTNKPSVWNTVTDKVDNLTISTSVELTENTWTSQIYTINYVNLIINTSYLPSGATLYLQPFKSHIPSGNPIDITNMLMREVDIYDYDEIAFKIENSGGSYTLPYTLKDDVIREYDLKESLSSKQDTIDTTHKLSADLVTDTSTTNKFVPTHSSTESGKVLSVDSQGNLVWVTSSGGHKIVESQNDPPTTSSDYEVGDEWIKGGAEVFKCVAKNGTSLTWGNLSLNNYDDLVTQIIGGNA